RPTQRQTEPLLETRPCPSRGGAGGLGCCGSRYGLLPRDRRRRKGQFCRARGLAARRTLARGAWHDGGRGAGLQVGCRWEKEPLTAEDPSSGGVAAEGVNRGTRVRLLWRWRSSGGRGDDRGGVA